MIDSPPVTLQSRAGNDVTRVTDCRPATVTEQRLRPANIGKRKPQQTIDRECASVNYTESASAEAQFHSSLIQSSQQSQNCTHLRYAFTGACIVRCCLWITSQQLSNATRHYQQRTREKRDRRRIRTLTSRVCRNDIINKVKIHQQSFSRLCFRCHEWRVACNRPSLVCPRIIAAEIAFEVALQVASVARSVFMTSQLYRRLSALSVLSRYCGVVNACRLPPVNVIRQEWERNVRCLAIVTS